MTKRIQPEGHTPAEPPSPPISVASSDGERAKTAFGEEDVSQGVEQGAISVATETARRLSTKEQAAIVIAQVEAIQDPETPWPKGEHLTVEELQALFQSAERGVFLMHQRSRHRIFLARVGLNRMTPTPESPVIRLDTASFLEYLQEENPDLAHKLRGKSMPDEVLILEQLSLRQLRKASVQHVLWRYWSWQVVGALIGQWRQLNTDAAAVRAEIGHTVFEGVRSTLERGRYLFDPEDDEEVVEQLVGWWGMLGHFAPYYRSDMFPSIASSAFDFWLGRQGIDLYDAVSMSRPQVNVPIPQHLPIPEPEPWLRWALADPEEFPQPGLSVVDDRVAATDGPMPTNDNANGAQVDPALKASGASRPKAQSTNAAAQQASGKAGKAAKAEAWPNGKEAGTSTFPLLTEIPQAPIDVKKLAPIGELARQPSWGALIFLLMLLGTASGIFYLIQNAGLSRVREMMWFVESLTGQYHLMLAPYSPTTLGVTLLGGYALLLFAHLVDVARNGSAEYLYQTQPPWQSYLTDEQREAARIHCEGHVRRLTNHWKEEVFVQSGKPALAEIAEAIVLGAFEWCQMHLGGGLLRLCPNHGWKSEWLARMLARQKLNHLKFAFGYHLKRVLHERRCGNDSVAIFQLFQAISRYQWLAREDDLVLQQLHSARALLEARVFKQFESQRPHFIAPTGGAFWFLFAALALAWWWGLSFRPLLYYLIWGFVFYGLLAHFLDVTSSIRREIHFWRAPAWRRYLLPSEVDEGREACLAHAQELWAESERERALHRQRPLLFEAISMVAGGLRWWAKVRLWGHLITAFLFQWGKLVPLLRFAAHQILRKQIFEFAYHLEWALHALERGNEAEAALQLTEAIAFYHPFVDSHKDLLLLQLIEQRNRLCEEIRDRFADALEITDAAERDNLNVLVRELIDVPLSTPLGRQCAAVLKTLQRSYLDKDRQFFLPQLFRWARSLGREPLQETLTHYGLVRSLHYLQAAQHKMSFLPLSEDKRERWAQPLRSAHHHLERAIRVLFGPKILDAMEQAGFVTANQREIVAQSKICDELLDLVIARGRFSFSDVRDVISRNDLRLHDPSWKEHLLGDRLLRLDQAFEARFHEIYRESEIYLRMLQRFSSMMFGTSVGRWLCLYILIPYGGAAMLLVFTASMVGLIYKFAFKIKTHPNLMTFPLVFSLGVLITLIVHTEAGRNIFKLILTGLGNGFRFLLFEAPRWVIQRPWIQEALKHPRALSFYRHFALPLGLALVLFGIEFGVIYIYDSGLLRWENMLLLFVASGFFAHLFLNTPFGRGLLDRLAYRWLAIWHQIKDRWVIGLIRLIIDGFRSLLLYLDYIIYRGDDLLRFHQGEGQNVIFFKVIGQAIWSTFTYIFRLSINLFLEPQINPIKHFPVVTVSHKMISLTMPASMMFLAQHGIHSPLILGAVAILFQFLLPGLCGFLVWEFKENWKLFRANQPEDLQPARLGPHGETMEALLRRGFHSGTLPKAYDKLHDYIHSEYLYMDRGKRRRLREQLHHVSEALEAFINRELLAAFRQHKSVLRRFPNAICQAPTLGPNHIDLVFGLETDENKPQGYQWLLRIELEGKWLLASLSEQEAPRDESLHFNENEEELLNHDLVALLQKCGTRIIRSKLETQLSFYLRSFAVGVPGAVTGGMRAEYRVGKEEVRVEVNAPGADAHTIVYQLDEDARLREPAPLVALEKSDKLLPSS